MMWFIVGIVLLVIVIIVCAFMLVELSKDESKFMEVSNQYLKNIGKSYTRDEYANWAFSFYHQVIMGLQNENYEFLRDVLADEIYNNYLISIKNMKDRNLKNVVENVKPIFSKLVSLVVKDDIEIAKVWLKISYVEYTIDVTPINEDAKGVITGDRVVAGNKNRHIEKEYMLTLVKNRTEKESIACPHCGYVSKIISQNTCSRCGANVVNRRYHWVLTGKEEIHTNR